MAHLRCDFFSDVLSLSTSMTVLLPEQTSTQIGLAGRARDTAPPVLYLLHGLSDDDTTWVRRTSIERYAAPLGLAVVMPQVHRSFYTDQAYGGRYWTFLSQELPSVVESFFRVSTRRADTFVAGLSMGGHGAMKWALRDPGRFAAAASLSGVLDARLRTRPEDPMLAQRIFGGRDPAGSDDDVLALLDRAEPAGLPSLYVACGTQDALIAGNRSFARHCEARDIPLTTDFGDGIHDWAYWDARIRDVLAWLPLTA